MEDNHFGKEAASEEKISDSLSRYREFQKVRSEREESHDSSNRSEEGVKVEEGLEAAKAQVREVVVEELSAASSQKERAPLHTETKVGKGNIDKGR